MFPLRIIVAGAGKVGYTIAGQLEAEGHDLTLIDTQEDRLRYDSDALDVQTVQGNCVNISVLEEAGAGRADVFLASTGEDEVNLISCLAARELGARRTAARIRNPYYFINEKDARFLQRQVDAAFNPDFEAASEIFRILQFPSAERVEHFSRSSIGLITYRIPADSPLVGMELSRMKAAFRTDILICIVQTAGDVIIPNGQYRIRAEDRITAAGNGPELKKFFVAAGAVQKPAHNILIMGGSRIAVYLARQLTALGSHVTIIEKKPERAEHLASLLRGCDIILGDGTRTPTLYEAGIESQDAFIALSDYDENNILTAMSVAKRTTVKTVVKVNGSLYSELLNGSLLESVICPKELAVQQITAYVRALQASPQKSHVEAMRRLADGRAEALEFIVRKGAAVTGAPLEKLELKSGILIAFVMRGGRSFPANGQTVIQDGDRAIVITTRKGLNDIDEILA